MRDHPELLLLSAYLDGELDDADRARLDVHVPDCPECRHTLGALRATVADLRALEPVELDAVSAAFIADRVSEARRFGGSAPARVKAARRWQWVAGAAAAGILAIGMLSANRDRVAPTRADTAGTEADVVDVVAGPQYTRASASAALAAVGTGTSQYSGERESGAGGARSLQARTTSVPANLDAVTAPPAQLYTCADGVTAEAAEALRPVRYETATFEGKDAFVFFFLAPAESPTRAEVWILRPSDCFTLYWAQRAL